MRENIKIDFINIYKKVFGKKLDIDNIEGFNVFLPMLEKIKDDGAVILIILSGVMQTN